MHPGQPAAAGCFSRTGSAPSSSSHSIAALRYPHLQIQAPLTTYLLTRKKLSGCQVRRDVFWGSQQ